jgi:type II secretory pathway pseudopilin PulG
MKTIAPRLDVPVSRPRVPSANRRGRAGQEAGERGFILLGVIVVIAALVGALTVTLRGSNEAMRNASSLRSRELVTQALQQGLDVGLVQLERTDPAWFQDVTVNNAWDLFDGPDDTLNDDFVANGSTFPNSGPYANEVRLRVGARPTQRTQAPPGEDARNAYGQVIELQIAADMPASPQSAEERVAVGVQVPIQSSYSK